jgi:outer membrane lipoprotein SlyB
MNAFWGSFRKGILCLIVVIGLVASGCATTSQGKQEQAAGALGGAALGALLGFAAGGTDGAIIGAAAGAVAGFAAVTLAQYHSAQVRSASEDQKIYGLTKVTDTPVVKIRQAMCSPERISPGQEVQIVTDYSVCLPPSTSQVSVQEQWILKKDGQQLHVIGSQAEQRATGGYKAGGAVTMPAKLKPGTYVIEHKVQAGTSYDVTPSVFYVN